MAWTTPLTATANAALTAAQWNASVRDNLLETAPAKATTSGSHFAGTGANTLAERFASGTFQGAAETTVSTTYTNLTTIGPAVTATHGGTIIIFFSATLSNNTVNGQSLVGYDSTGTYVSSASDASSIRFTSPTANAVMAASQVFVVPGTPAGTTTFTLKYRVTAGTGTFNDRRVQVLPF